MLSAYNPNTRQWEEFTYFPETYHSDTGTWHWANGFVYWGGRWVHAWRTIDTTVAIPTVVGTYTYTRNSSGAVTQTVSLNYDSTKCEIVVSKSTTQASAYKAEGYDVYFKLKDNHSQWSDGSLGEKKVTWFIQKRVVSLPTVTASYTFTKDNVSTAHTYTVSKGNGYNYDDLYVDFVETGSERSGSTYKAAGYNLNFKLKDTASCLWSDNTTINQSKKWYINRRTLTTPSQSGSITYDGQYHTPTWDSNFDTKYMTVSVTEKRDANTNYSASFTMLSDCQANCLWKSGAASTSSVTANWKINKATLSAPTTGTALTYNGSSQSATSAINGYNSNTMTVISGGSQTDAGTYSVRIGLRDTTNYQWSGTTNTYVDVPWYINQKRVTVRGSDSYFKVYVNNTKPIPIDLTFSDIDAGIYTEPNDPTSELESFNGYTWWQFGYIMTSSGSSYYQTVTLYFVAPIPSTSEQIDIDNAYAWTSFTTKNYILTGIGVPVATARNPSGVEVYVIVCSCKGSWQQP